MTAVKVSAGGGATRDTREDDAPLAAVTVAVTSPLAFVAISSVNGFIDLSAGSVTIFAAPVTVTWLSRLSSFAVTTPFIAATPEFASAATQAINQAISVPEVAPTVPLSQITAQRNDKSLFIPNLLAAHLVDLDFAGLFSATRTIRPKELLTSERMKDSLHGALTDCSESVDKQSSAAFVANAKTHSVALQTLISEYQQNSVAEEEDLQQCLATHSHKQNKVNQMVVDEFHANLVEAFD
jgi:hypothetical protein